MNKLLSIITLNLIAISSNAIAEYPDHYYELAGLLGIIGPDTYMEWGEFKEKKIEDQDYYFGPFWNSERKAAYRIKEIIESLDVDEKSADRVEVIIEDRPAVSIRSPFLKKTIDEFYSKAPSKNLAPSEELFEEASEKQLIIYLSSVYFRWGEKGKNVITSPNVDFDRIICILDRFCIGVQSLHQHSLIPGGTQITFIPDKKLREELGIDTLLEFTRTPIGWSPSKVDAPKKQIQPADGQQIK